MLILGNKITIKIVIKIEIIYKQYKYNNNLCIMQLYESEKCE